MHKTLEKLTPNEIFGLTVIGEARGEPIEGQVAVSYVIYNRFKHRPKKYDDFKDVCLEPYQFSCWLDNDPNFSFLIEIGDKMLIGDLPTDMYLKQCLYVAAGVVSGMILDNTNGSLHYLANWLYNNPNKRPNWAMTPLAPKTIGRQTFFNI